MVDAHSARMLYTTTNYL